MSGAVILLIILGLVLIFGSFLFVEKSICSVHRLVEEGHDIFLLSLVHRAQIRAALERSCTDHLDRIRKIN